IFRPMERLPGNGKEIVPSWRPNITGRYPGGTGAVLAHARPGRCTRRCLHHAERILFSATRDAIARDAAPMRQPPGKIMLIGSGPGDPELLTLKAARAIQAADVLLVDALVHPAVLDHAKTTATIIDVGKRAGIASPSQDSINELMVAHAKKGLLVARVKGGDPMLFSRAGEELLFAARNRVTIEVINGVTAACAAAASSLIPLTLRGTATSVVFITGTTCSQHDYANWNALAQSG